MGTTYIYTPGEDHEAVNRNLDSEALAAAVQATRDLYNSPWLAGPEDLAKTACSAYMDDLIRQLAELTPCEDCDKEDQMVVTQKTQRKLEPDFQNGENVIVLGAREGNIGGAIAERLCRYGYIAQEDDCYRPTGYEEVGTTDEMKEVYFRSDYQPPQTKNLEPYSACVITLGATHMERFSQVSRVDFRKVMYGSLELPLECARRYVRARLKCHQCPRGLLAPAGSLSVCTTCGTNEPTGQRGTIVFIGSYAHDHPFTHCTSYCTAKAGLDMAARSLAWELMPEGFRVHIIHPHHVQGTPMTDEVLKGMQKGVHRMTPEQARDYQHKDLRMPDLLKPEEVAEMVFCLLENKVMQWTSGTSINMYGGVR